MEFSELVDRISTLNAPDAFNAPFSPDHWTILSRYLIPFDLKTGDLLIEQGESDRVAYFLGHGTLQVFVRGAQPGKNKVAILRAGALVGEPSLFGDVPRMANVGAISDCTVWALSGLRFEELVQSRPDVALVFLRSAGAVMASRMRANMVRHTPFT